jgi:AcrR family transcriptional regulator
MDNASARRAELLAKIVDAFLAGGVADLSLRPLAARVGTSARLLIYHFETKEKLLACALAAVRARADASLRALAAREQPKTLSAVLLMFWEWAIEDPNQRYFRLLFEVDGLLMFDRLGALGDSRQDGGAVWLGMIDRAVAAVAPAPDPASGRSTLIMGAMNGLLQDYLSTGDRTRTTAALIDLADLLSADAGARPNQHAGAARGS